MKCSEYCNLARGFQWTLCLNAAFDSSGEGKLHCCDQLRRGLIPCIRRRCRTQASKGSGFRPAQLLKAFIPRFIYNRLPSSVGHFWCECHLDERWVTCETLFDEPLYLSMLGVGLVTRAQIPTLDWDGESDLIVLQSWIASDEGTYPAFDDVLASPMMSEAGMPPKILCKSLDPILVFLSRCRTDTIRGR